MTGTAVTFKVSQIVSDQTLSRMIQIESGGKPNAKAPTSSALGLGQFLDKTWLGTVKAHRPDWLTGNSRAAVLAMRREPEKSIEMLARFTEDNAHALGNGWTDGDLYLAHFSGAGVARKVMHAPASAPASNYFDAGAIRANRSILQGRTAGQVRAWAAKRMAQSGGHDWVGKYWVEDEPAAAEPDADAIPDDAALVRSGEAAPEADAAEAKPLMQSKIAQAGAGVGLIGGGEIVSQASDAAEKVKALKDSAGDIGVTDYIGHALNSPRMLMAIATVVLVAFIIYWRWRDHGAGRAA